MAKKQQKRSYAGLWIILVAAVVLEATACVQYFYSRAAIRQEAEYRAKTELRRAELEIEKHTIEMETAGKALAMLAEKYVDSPDSIFAATRSVVKAIPHTTSIAISFVPDYFPQYGRYFEACSSRISEDSIYTRQIGSAAHDYTLLEWYQNGLKDEGGMWSEPYLDDSGSQKWVVSYSQPVHNRKGDVVGVICVDLSLDYLQQLSEYLQLYKGSYYSISSSKGMDIVARPDTVAGRKYTIFDEEIDATGWQISIIIPDEVIYADLRRMGMIISLMMFLGLALLVFIIWRAGVNILRLMDSTAKNQSLENELYIARAIQMAMLPKVAPPFTDRRDLNIYGLLNPAKEVGGDLYDFYIRHNKLFFCIGDVSGKGVPAALVMSMTRSLFRNVTAHQENAAAIVNEINTALAEQNTQTMFLTLFLGVLDLDTGILNYCNAGHNAPVYLPYGHTNAAMEFLPVIPNIPIGIEPTFEFRDQTTWMTQDDLLFLYTDGLTEAENSALQLFGEQRMLSTLAEQTNSRPRGMVEAMQASVEAFVGNAQQSDDLTMLAIRFQRPAIFMRNDIQQIPTLSEWIETLDIPAELNMPVNLALEEIVSNVMLYAYPGQSGRVIVEFAKIPTPETLIFTVSDNGIPFDPTTKENVDTTLSAEDREIGGLGIHLVRQLMDEIHYRREEDTNVLTLIKHL